MTESEFDQRIDRALELLSRLGIIGLIDRKEFNNKINQVFDGDRFSQLYQVSRNRERLSDFQDDIIIQKADKFSNFRRDYIYIWWNGLEVGQYAQSTPFIFIPAQTIRMGVMAAIANDKEVQGLGLAFPNWSNGYWVSNGLPSQRILQTGYFRWTLNVHQGFDIIRSIWGEGKVGSESQGGYRAYAIKIEDWNESKLGEVILPLNYALKGFDLNRDTQV
tara:strand:- start:12299 stop:12955 length:657 start_codon:yes stop_codon:yes gene_type:complete